MLSRKFWILASLCLLALGTIAQEPEPETEVEEEGGAETEGESEGEAEEEAEPEGDTESEAGTQPNSADEPPRGDFPSSEVTAQEDLTDAEDSAGAEAVTEDPTDAEDSAEAVTDGGDDAATEEPAVTQGAAATEEPAPAEEPCDPSAYEARPSFTVTSILVPPYLMEPTNDTANVTEGDRHCGHSHGDYVGYIIDLLDAIADHLEMRYELNLVADEKYGAEEGGAWTGMVGEVVNGVAQVAAAPLTVTLEREKVVDFTHPFQVFETVAVIQHRPRNHEEPVHTLQDLFDYDFQFGVAENSTTEKVLMFRAEDLEEEPHKAIWENINRERFVGIQKSNNRGVRKARWDDTYAFLMEGSSADWVLRQEPCDLDAIPTAVHKGQYAMAVPNQDPLRDQINEAMMELHHDGTMDKLKDKWWPNQCGGAGAMTSSVVLATILVFFSVLLQKH